MPEREPIHPFFDRQATSDLLGPPRGLVDSELGQGWRYRAPDSQACVDVFPAKDLTRLLGRFVDLRIAGVPLVDREREQVYLDHLTADGKTTIELTANQHTLVFVYTSNGPDTHLPPPPAQLPGADESDTGATAHSPLSPSEQTPPAAPAAVAEPDPDARSPRSSQAASATQEAAPRLQLTGRMGRDPSFRTTKTGTLVGRFPLAVHHEDGQTSWRTVLAFGPRAEQLQRRTQAGELAKGAEVDVVGYLHRNQRPSKDGSMRTVEEIYAVAVKSR